MTTLALEKLKQHRIHQNELRLAAGVAWQDHDWVFCNGVGNPIEAGNLLRHSFWPILENEQGKIVKAL